MLKNCAGEHRELSGFRYWYGQSGAKCLSGRSGGVLAVAIVPVESVRGRWGSLSFCVCGLGD